MKPWAILSVSRFILDACYHEIYIERMLNSNFSLCYRPPGDAWTRLATMVNLLEKLNYTRMTLIQGKDTEDREENKGMLVSSLSLARDK